MLGQASEKGALTAQLRETGWIVCQHRRQSYLKIPRVILFGEWTQLTPTHTGVFLLRHPYVQPREP